MSSPAGQVSPPAPDAPATAPGLGAATPSVPEPAIAGIVPDGWTLAFADGFDGTGDLGVGRPGSLWRFESLADPLHRAGNAGMDERGNTDVPAWRSPAGKRWSGWYDGYHADNAYRSDGHLVMQGLATAEPDPTRGADRYVDEGVPIDYSSGKLYTVWLDTWARVWDQSRLGHVVDPASPGRTFRYGYFETRVSFEDMVTPGFRLSWWLMPASRDVTGHDLVVGDAYDADGDNGVEIDVFEYEYFSNEKPNRVQLAVHGGVAGRSADTFDTTTIGVDLREGFHTIGFLWEAERLLWMIDGVVVKSVTDASLIPDVYSYMILSRELNSGVKRAGVDGVQDEDTPEALPYRPRDPGLYARNVWAWRDRLAIDRARIDYVRVWQP